MGHDMESRLPYMIHPWLISGILFRDAANSVSEKVQKHGAAASKEVNKGKSSPLVGYIRRNFYPCTNMAMRERDLGDGSSD